MAAKAKAGGDRARRPAAGSEAAGAAAAPPPASTAPAPPDPTATAAGDEGEDDALLGPLWARLAIGAAGGVIVVSIGWFAIAPYVIAQPEGGVKLAKVPPVTGMFILCGLPFLLAAAGSVAADLSRAAPRIGLAAMTGAAAAGSGFITAALITAVSYFLAPLGLAGIALLRSLLAPPAPGVRRADHVIQWVFVGVFWPTAIGVAAGFLLRNGFPRVVALALAGGLLGAVTTWMCASLDPDAPAADDPLAGDDAGPGKDPSRDGAGG